jgi:hypothetical protein
MPAFPTADENECLRSTAPCGPNTNCADKVGSYDCPCKTGFSGNGFDTTNGCQGELVLVALVATGSGSPLLSALLHSHMHRRFLPLQSWKGPQLQKQAWNFGFQLLTSCCAPADTTPPKLAFTSAVSMNDLTVAAEAVPTAGSAAVAFPAMAASDTNTDGGANAAAALLSRANCSATVGSAGAWQQVFPRGSASATAFPVGSSLVVCTTKDDAGNESPALSFVVTVRCPTGYALTNNTCIGAFHRVESKGGASMHHCICLGHKARRCTTAKPAPR